MRGAGFESRPLCRLPWYSSVYTGQFRDRKTSNLRPLSSRSFPVLSVSVILTWKYKSVALKTSWNCQPQEFRDGSKYTRITILVFVSWWRDGYIIMNCEGAFLYRHWGRQKRILFDTFTKRQLGFETPWIKCRFLFFMVFGLNCMDWDDDKWMMNWK